MVRICLPALQHVSLVLTNLIVNANLASSAFLALCPFVHIVMLVTPAPVVKMRRLLSTIFIVCTLLLAALAVALLYPRQVAGVIRDEAGPGIAHAVILLRERVLYPDEAGYYNLGWIVGPFTLDVQADGYLPQRAMIPTERLLDLSTYLPVTLTPNTLSGTVYDSETGAPLANSRVSAGQESLLTDEQGHYVLQRIRSGTLLGAVMPGYQTQAAVFSGQDVQDFPLQPTRTEILVTDLYTLQPVANVSIVYDSMETTTDASGAAVVRRLLPDSHLFIQSPGYESIEYLYSSSERVSIALRPNTLQGVVRDSKDSSPLAGVNVGLVSTGQVITATVTGKDGRYLFKDIPAPVTLTVTALDYERREEPIGQVTEMDIALRPFEVRGIYMPLGLLTSQSRVLELIDLVDNTELNTIVVDMKNDRGWLAFPSALVEAQRSKAYRAEVMDPRRFLELCKEKGIYTIARVVLFKDPSVVAAYPEWAVRTADDQLYVDTEGSTWLDPFRSEVQDYLVAIAREVAGLGFDELQFDYLRFPSDGSAGKARYSQESTRESRCTTIREFCARLHRELEPYGVVLSADLFGLTVWVEPENDMGIGQRVIDIAPYVDYLSPMLYPATFVSGNLGYDEPMRYPYEIVYRSCIELGKRTNTRVRPWLQHYSWKGIDYGTPELRLEKQAADDAGTYGWMFWHAGGKYDANVFDVVENTP